MAVNFAKGANALQIQLKNGSWIQPMATAEIDNSYTTLDDYDTKQISQAFTVRDEPNVNYGIIIDENGEGWRFYKHGVNQPIASSEYETKSISQILEIQGSEFPITYVNDNKKTGKVSFEIYTDNIAFKNRFINTMSKSNYLYVFIPKRWNHSLKTGFYSYETMSESRLGFTKADGTIWHISIDGARMVQGDVSQSPTRTWQVVANKVKNYDKVIENYRDWSDLAIPPTSDLTVGEYEN
jgi:hypothetical protein